MKNLQKHDVFSLLLKVPKIVFGCLWECFSELLEGLRAVLGASWAPGGRLGGVLGVSGNDFEGV